jgi:predicted DNA-binding antitoxin AbrB/MazE fold protein
MQTITATFEDGVLEPAQPLDLPNHSHVRVTIELLKEDAPMAQRLAALEELLRIIEPHSGDHLTRDQLHERG